MSSDPHIKAIMELPTVEIAAAILRLQSELQRRRDAAIAAAAKPRVTLQPE